MNCLALNLRLELDFYALTGVDKFWNKPDLHAIIGNIYTKFGLVVSEIYASFYL